jgi:hypothetical protein
MELSAATRTQAASELMLAFAERTRVGAKAQGTRYLWTDAFAVCNFLGLARTTGDRRYTDLALRLVDGVHHTLGRFRADDARFGWISGLNESEGQRHPTRGGLRIGKRLPERRANEAFDEALEWERDGQYFHYLTKWMHALDQTARATGEARFNAWACELAEAAIPAFASFGAGRERRGITWKMSTDLSRPLVSAHGQHDPLDGFVTCAELRVTARAFASGRATPTLERELGRLRGMLTHGDWVTSDLLGIGSLLVDAARLGQLAEAGGREHAGLLQQVFSDAVAGLSLPEVLTCLRMPVGRRLAFRELGLAIGLAAAHLAGSANPTVVAAMSRYAALGEAVLSFWLDPTRRRSTSWSDHQDINDVMLATSLLPDGFLILSGPLPSSAAPPPITRPSDTRPSE